MTTTINVAFDPTAIPAWAQRLPAVVARCETDLAYRCNVCSAKTRFVRRLLAKDARGAWMVRTS